MPESILAYLKIWIAQECTLATRDFDGQLSFESSLAQQGITWSGDIIGQILGALLVGSSQLTSKVLERVRTLGARQDILAFVADELWNWLEFQIAKIPGAMASTKFSVVDQDERIKQYIDLIRGDLAAALDIAKAELELRKEMGTRAQQLFSNNYSPLPGIVEREPRMAPPLSLRLPVLTLEELEAAYDKRLANWLDDKAPPNRDQDTEFLQSISSEVTTKLAREIRAKRAPSHWRAGGRPKSRINP